MRNVAKDIKEGGREFIINYQSLPLENVLKREIELMKSFEGFLDPKNKENSRFINKTGVRETFIKMLLVQEQRIKMMKFAETLQKFDEKMRYSNPHQDSEGIPNYKSLLQMKTNKDNPQTAYNIRFVSPFEKIDPVKLFSVAAIEAARRTGKLEKIQAYSFPFYEQVRRQDPKKPDDPNAKIWVHELRRVKVEAYDSNGDKDKNIDYIVVFKSTGQHKNGKEIFDKFLERPSLQIFRSPGSSNPNVMILDKNGDAFPEKVDNIPGIDHSKDLLFFKKSETIDILFSEDDEGKDLEEKLKGYMKGYQPPEQHFDVAMVGETKIKEFKTNDDGWPLPAHFNYKNARANNFKVEIIWEMPTKKDGSNMNYKKIKMLKKIYHAPDNAHSEGEGNVVEYFRLPKEYTQRDIREATVTGTKNQTLDIQRKGKAKESWHIDDILPNAPFFAIEYDKGDNRELLVNQNNKTEANSAYEAKKIISKKSPPKTTYSRDNDHPGM